MSATVAIDHSIEHGEYVQEIGSITMDSSYPTGGEAIDATGDSGWFHCSLAPNAGYIPEFDVTNQKVKVYDQKDPAAAGGADIALPEVASTTNLATVVFRFSAYRVK